MKWLIGLLGAIGVVAAIATGFFLRNRRAASSLVSEAKDTTASWGKTAADKAGEATNKVIATAEEAAGAASDAV